MDYKIIKPFCDGHGFQMLSSELLDEQIAEVINESITPDEIEKKKVYSFFSSVSNIGTTSTAFSVAKSLAANTDMRVGVLVLNAWDSGEDYQNYSGRYLDELKGALLNQIYEEDKAFLNIFHEEQKDTLYYLLGNRNTKLERLYTKEEVAYLINRSKRIFDAVLIDAGSHFDNANMLQSLYSSDYRFLVMNQQLKARRKWKEIFQDILKPIGFENTDFMLVINDFKNENMMTKAKELNQVLQIPLLTTIRHTKHGYLSEIEKKTLYEYDDTHYKESIDIICRTITGNLGFKFGSKEQKKSLFKIAR